MWFRRKPEPVAPKPEKTAEELAACAAAELECWRRLNPIRSYRVTFKDSTTRDIRSYWHESSEVWTDFRAWQTEGWSGKYAPLVTVFRCRSSDIIAIELKDPLPEALLSND